MCIRDSTYAGALLFDGERIATAWSDARQDGNYEIYFNRLTAQGEKLSPDLQLSQAERFSLHPALVEIDERVLVAWDDHRFATPDAAAVRIFGVLVGDDGSLSQEVPLSADGELAEFPALAVGQERLGMAYTVLEQNQVFGRFKTFDRALGGASPAVDLGLDVTDPVVVAAAGRFVVAWYTKNPSPGPAIVAAVVGEDGVVVKNAVPVTSGASFARTASLLSLGDRVLLVWADDLDGNYELYSLVMDADLNVLRGRERLTFDSADTLSPSAVLLKEGGVGVVFDDYRSGTPQVYFTRLECGGP